LYTGAKPAPTLRRGEQPPVAQPVAQGGVGDVVRAERQALDQQPRLALAEILAQPLALDHLAGGEVPTADTQLGHARH
jgi:hypothetical protein